ncbi:MAG TPA: hypothetical protein ENK55_12095 [Actinobacteria bacterium]|nr:hypothetical protein [Actinomycetota bacterium]
MPSPPPPPTYDEATLADLSIELAARLGVPATRHLAAEVASVLPEGSGTVVVLFDGLGTHQLGHPAAGPLAEDLAATIDTVFPTTTTVALATVATGLPPSRHGLLGYHLWLPEVGEVVNTIRWTTPWGEPVGVDTVGFLPTPNLWERLAASGIEPITIQPAAFSGSPLSRLLYRGCRFEPVASLDEAAHAALQLAGPGRFVLVYCNDVDVAAHEAGQTSSSYAEALGRAAKLWDRLRTGLPPDVGLVGTADHGHVDVPERRRYRLPAELQAERILYGDSRVLFVRGPAIDDSDLPATWLPFAAVSDWWGPGPRHPSFEVRRPDGVLVADDGWVVLHRHANPRLVGHHGGLSPPERRIPVLARR